MALLSELRDLVIAERDRDVPRLQLAHAASSRSFGDSRACTVRHATSCGVLMSRVERYYRYHTSTASLGVRGGTREIAGGTMGEFAGKIVVVSGGSRGIGRSIAEAFAREGAQTVLAAASLANLAKAAEAIAASGAPNITVAFLL